MEFLLTFLSDLLLQFQKPALAFLIGGMLLAAFQSKLKVPDAIYQFIVFMLLMRIGLEAGMEIRHADLTKMLMPALFSVLIGCAIVLIGVFFFTKCTKVNAQDAFATAGLFGAVSASTLAAGMMFLEEEAILFEAWAPALYPFMDIPALILAIVLASLALKKQEQKESTTKVKIWPIIKNSLRGSALSALLLGIALGLLTRPERVFESFYDPLFRGLLSILMLVMGMEAYARLNELRRVAHWFAIYAFIAPIFHGLIGFGLGAIAHYTVGFSPGGVVILAILAASNSDISGPPTLRGGIPKANPASYIGSSTSVGTPVAIAICIPLFIALAQNIFEL